MHIGWPQGILLGLMTIRVLIFAAKDGEPRPDNKYQFGIALSAALIQFGLLYWGGFFA